MATGRENDKHDLTWKTIRITNNCKLIAIKSFKKILIAKKQGVTLYLKKKEIKWN